MQLRKMILMVLIAGVLLLAGCSEKTQPPAELPEGGFDNSGEKTVLYRGEKSFPLSFTVDGEQQIENGVYWYYELADTYERSWDELFYTYDAEKLELDGSKAYDKLNRDTCFATNGNWPLFLNPVHTEYTASNQNMVDKGLIELSRKQLEANQMPEAEPIVTDVWVCDMDGDNAEETLFKAAGSAGESGSYCFLAYSAGESCQVLYGDFNPGGATPVEKLNPMVCDLNGDGNWGLLLYKKSDYESFTIYLFSGGNFTKGSEIIF